MAKTKKKQAIDKHALVTNKLIALIEKGVKPWNKAWGGAAAYSNLITDHKYKGLNPLLCTIDVLTNNWEYPYFLSYNQAKANNWQVKKGSKATWIRWVAPIATTEINKDGEETDSMRFTCKWYSVFNVACIDDSESEVKIESVIGNKPKNKINTEPRISEAEELIKAQKAIVNFGGDRACYSSKADKIQMPCYEDFIGAASYYSVYIHELIHRTGHSSRLDRKLGNRFGSEAYAFEELIAEIGSAMTCSELFLEHCLENHASYLDNWLSILKKDKRAFFNAADSAKKASDYLFKQLEN